VKEVIENIPHASLAIAARLAFIDVFISNHSPDPGYSG
jgi:hypothetical protein